MSQAGKSSYAKICGLVMSFVAGLFLVGLYFNTWMIESKYNTSKSFDSKTSHDSSVSYERFQFNYTVSNALYGIPSDRFSTLLPNNTLEYRYLRNYKNPCWLENNTVWCLPYFYILGVARCGSTMLYKLIERHQDVVPPVEKELNMWQIISKRNSKAFNTYLNKFAVPSCTITKRTRRIKDKVVHDCITYEGTPSYFCNQGNLNILPGNRKGEAPTFTLAHTLYALFPKTKLIIILRNPTDRLLSYYRLFLKQPYNISVFGRKMREAVAMMKACLAVHSVRHCVYDVKLTHTIFSKCGIDLACSMYHPFAEDWLKVFPKNQTLFVKSEQFYNNSLAVMKRIFNFLGLGPSIRYRRSSIADLIQFKKWKLQKAGADIYRSEMLPETRRLLDDFFLPFNNKLANLLKDDQFRFTRD